MSDSRTKKPMAFMEPVGVSSQLEEVVGRGPMPRSEVTKRLWEYIKKHNLQDRKNKRLINSDAKLATIFGTREPVDMFKMTSLVSKHLKRLDKSRA